MLYDFLPVACFPATVSLSGCSQPGLTDLFGTVVSWLCFREPKISHNAVILSEAKTNSRFNKRMTNSPEYVVV